MSKDSRIVYLDPKGHSFEPNLEGTPPKKIVDQYCPECGIVDIVRKDLIKLPEVRKKGSDYAKKHPNQ